MQHGQYDGRAKQHNAVYYHVKPRNLQCHPVGIRSRPLRPVAVQIAFERNKLCSIKKNKLEISVTHRAVSGGGAAPVNITEKKQMNRRKILQKSCG